MSFTSIETANRMAAVAKKQKEGGDVIGTLTLRDYFAAKAMQGFIQYSAAKGIYTPPDDELAKVSYDLADAMLKAREA